MPTSALGQSRLCIESEKFFEAIQQNFQPDAQVQSMEIGHGRVEARTVSLWRDIEALPQAD
ncbi:MAG: hypothetical protein AAFQ89_23445 [Cyanobacteria bacterium J06626_18]